MVLSVTAIRTGTDRKRRRQEEAETGREADRREQLDHDVHRCSSRCDSGLTERAELEENESQAKVNLLLLLLWCFYSKVIVFVLETTSHSRVSRTVVGS